MHHKNVSQTVFNIIKLIHRGGKSHSLHYHVEVAKPIERLGTAGKIVGSSYLWMSLPPSKRC